MNQQTISSRSRIQLPSIPLQMGMHTFSMGEQSEWHISKEVKLPLGLLYLAFLLSILIALSTYFILQPVIPLLYTVAQPQQQLVAKEWIFLFPFLIGAITILHTGITYILRNGHQLLTQLFLWTSVFIVSAVLLSLIRILFLVL